MPDEPEPNYDPDSATIPMSGPRPTLSGSQVDLPLPEELTKLLPAGAYQITGFLGAGGMGAVYKGTQVRLKRPVAIKIMRRDMGRDHDFEARFEREAQAMAKLNHPNIISVIDFGEAGPDYLFIVMELVDGTDLMEVIRSKQMTQEMALGLLPQICDALQFAHDHGIVHRDIKPGNIMLTRDGRVKMADFGLAKHFDAVDSGFRTQTGTGMGTPDYAAPEQFDPTTPIDHRADIYALGVMIYQMITGALPRGVWRPPSQRAEVAPQWDNVVSRAMQNDPADRYQKASEVKTELGTIPLTVRSTDIPVRDPAGSPQRGASKDTNKNVRATSKSRTPQLLGVIGVVAIIAAGAFFVLTPSDQNRTEPASAAENATDPRVIKLWDSPQSLSTAPSVAKVRWENGALRHDGGASLIDRSVISRDGILRAAIRTNADARVPALGMRSRMVDGKNHSYALRFETARGLVELRAVVASQDHIVAKWPIPHPYPEDEWAAIQWRILGNTHTIKLDGQFLGEAQDTTVPEAGSVSVFAGGNAFFRDIEYMPMDEPASTAVHHAYGWKPLLPEAVWQKSAPRREFANGLLHVTATPVYARLPGENAADGAVRATVKLLPQTRNPSVHARWSGTSGYQWLLQGEIEKMSAQLFFVRGQGSGSAPIAVHTLSKQPAAGESVTLELRVQGDLLTGLVNGEVCVETRDKSRAEAGEWGIYASDAWFESAEVQTLPTVASAPSQQFPCGQWVKLFTKPEDLPADLRKPDSGVTWEDGWIRVGKNRRYLGLPGALKGNYAIRLRAKNDEAAGIAGEGVVVRKHDSENAAERGYYLSRFGGNKFLIQQMVGGKYETLHTSAPSNSPAQGQDYTLQVGVVGRRLVSRLNSTNATVLMDASIPQGGAYLGIPAPIRDIEVINLDGLPEAEALRLLGVDEQGQDLRRESAPVSKSSEPGAIMLWDTPAKIPKGAKVRWEDGALVLEAPQILFFEEKLSRDGIVRASFLRNAKESDRYVGVRGGRSESGRFQCYRVAPDFEKGVVVLHCELGKETKFLKDWRLPRPVEPNGWMQVELRVVGDELTVSADGQVIGTFRNSTLTEPGGAILWGHTGDAFRDIEYVPLDTPATVAPSPSPPVPQSSSLPSRPPPKTPPSSTPSA